VILERSLRFLAPVLFACAAVACESPAPEPTPDPNALTSATTARGPSSATTKPPRTLRPGAHPARPSLGAHTPTKPDPLNGKFDLAAALKGLPPKGDIIAKFETDAGNFQCKLYDDKAPITVANFVGLARGNRPAWNGSDWVTKPAYDGTLFHRIVKGFMIQGGSMNGAEETGYTIPDELWGGKHDRAGLLCMANRGANTNSKQFFITDDAAPHLDKGYTIFGECTPLDVIHAIASVPVKGDHPVTPPVIKSIRIERGGKSAPVELPAPSASASAGPAPSASAKVAPAPSASAKH
jgi:peptidyl-prolyl cis-trans isomerase A (cyclophilin A)